MEDGSELYSPLLDGAAVPARAIASSSSLISICRLAVLFLMIGMIIVAIIILLLVRIPHMALIYLLVTLVQTADILPPVYDFPLLRPLLSAVALLLV